MIITTRKEKMNPASLRHVFQTMTLLTLAILSVSCAHTKAYVEPSESSEQVAVLQAEAPVWIVSIDGERVSNKGLGDHKEFKVRPGSHRVEVSLAGMETVEVREHGETFLVRRNFQSRGTAKIQFAAAAGQYYLLGYKKSTPGYYDISGKWEPVIHAFQPFPATAK